MVSRLLSALISGTSTLRKATTRSRKPSTAMIARDSGSLDVRVSAKSMLLAGERHRCAGGALRGVQLGGTGGVVVTHHPRDARDVGNPRPRRIHPTHHARVVHRDPVRLPNHGTTRPAGDVDQRLIRLSGDTSDHIGPPLPNGAQHAYGQQHAWWPGGSTSTGQAPPVQTRAWQSCLRLSEGAQLRRRDALAVGRSDGPGSDEHRSARWPPAPGRT